MSWVESAHTFNCSNEQLLGVLARPTTPSPPLAVLFVVGGMQYRIGAHRQHVLLARHLAAQGVPSFRFDVRGMGDSTGTYPGFDNLQDDIHAALQVLQTQCPGAQVVLYGLCDGASAAMQYANTHPSGIAGLCLLNPWVRSESTLAQTRLKHYYGQRLLQADFWKKALGGGIGLRNLSEWWRNRQTARTAFVATADFLVAMQSAWEKLPVPILAIVGEQDLTGQEFFRVLETQPGWSRRDLRTIALIAGADHTFSQHAWQAALFSTLLQWLQPLQS